MPRRARFRKPRRVNQLLFARHLFSDTKQSDQNLDPFQSETLAGPPKSEKVDSWTFLILPKAASAKLPSRGVTAIGGTINGVPFQAELEPDGQKSHWLKVNRKLRKSAGADAGDVVNARDSADGTIGTGGTGRCEKSSRGRRVECADVVVGHHAQRAPGLDPLDQLRQAVRDARATDQKCLLDVRGRESDAFAVSTDPGFTTKA